MKRFFLALSYLVSAGAFTGTAQAHPPAASQPAQRQYYAVYYRASPAEPWRYYGWTGCPTTANYHAGIIRHSGYESFVSTIRY
jgi:hypothetical protein